MDYPNLGCVSEVNEMIEISKKYEGVESAEVTHFGPKKVPTFKVIGNEKFLESMMMELYDELSSKGLVQPYKPSSVSEPSLPSEHPDYYGCEYRVLWCDYNLDGRKYRLFE